MEKKAETEQDAQVKNRENRAEGMASPFCPAASDGGQEAYPDASAPGTNRELTREELSPGAGQESPPRCAVTVMVILGPLLPLVSCTLVYELTPPQNP